MGKRALQATLEEDYLRFLVNGLRNNDLESITKWVEENLVGDNPNTTDARKIAFYEAEKAMISEYIEQDKFDTIQVLIDTIDNKRFDNNQKLKVNECRIIAKAIITKKEYLTEDVSMHKNLCQLLNIKYKELTDEGYKNKIVGIINEALSIVSHESLEVVTTMGDDAPSSSG